MAAGAAVTGAPKDAYPAISRTVELQVPYPVSVLGAHAYLCAYRSACRPRIWPLLRGSIAFRPAGAGKIDRGLLAQTLRAPDVPGQLRRIVVNEINRRLDA